MLWAVVRKLRYNGPYADTTLYSDENMWTHFLATRVAFLKAHEDDCFPDDLDVKLHLLPLQPRKIST